MASPLEQLDLLKALLADQYDVERELGRGGMATVYLATDRKHGRKVAVKVLSPEVASSVGVERFLREIEIAARLTHPHILPLHDSGNANGLLYYVMPFVEGESIRDRLARDAQLPVKDALRITREVAEALEYAHDHGVIHRDIKPGNILLLGKNAVVADFGIARALAQSGGDRLTETGLAVGTPDYMSPEQAGSEGKPDARSDIYALGCVLFEMLAGRPPLTGPTPQATFARRVSEPPPGVHHMRSTVTHGLEGVISKALAPVPADRFQTAREFRRALEQQETLPGLPAMESPARRVPGRRSLAWLAAAAVLGLAAVGVKQLTDQESPRTQDGRSAGLLPSSSPIDPNRIAVLYFEDLSPGSELGHIATGLTEGLIDELGRIAGLEVVSPNGVRPFRHADVSADSVGRALAVGTVVGGSVAQSGDLLRVNVRLVEAGTNRQLDAASVDRPRIELFALQDTLAKEVAELLRRSLGEEVRLRGLRSGTRVVEAWELMQRAEEEAHGAQALAAGGDLPAAEATHAHADSLLARAGRLDAGWVQPLLLRAQLAYQRSRWTATQDRERTAGLVEEAGALVQRALEIEPENSDALELRGTIRYWSWLLNLYPDRADELFELAEDDLRGAVARNPRQAGAWATLSHLFTNIPGSTSESQLAARRAYEADAYLSNADVVLFRLFLASYDLDDHVQARRWCNEGYRRFSEDFRFTDCRLWLLTMHAVDPDLDRASELLREFDRLVPPQQAVLRGRARMAVSAVAAKAGLRDSAIAIVEGARAGPDVDPTRDLSYMEAFTQTLLGRPDSAIRLLAEYLAANPSDGGESLDHWWFEALSSEPGFQTLTGVGE